MNKKILGLALAGLLAAAVQAVPITGSVDMSGTITLDSTLLGSANAAVSFTNVVVGGSPTGAYTGTVGSSVTWSAFSWDPVVLPPTLWTFDYNGSTYSFVLENITVAGQSNSFLNLEGAGKLSISGGVYDTTDGNWSLSITNAGGAAHANFQFTFANAQTAVPGVPDGGSTLMLLGGALMGVAATARRFLRAA